MAKTNRINLRLTQAEYEQVKARAGSQPLARWCANIVLANQGVVKPRPVKTRYTGADPALIRELNAIGNNLNQVARLGNMAKRKGSLELWQLIECLQQIESDLAAIVEAHKDAS